MAKEMSLEQQIKAVETKEVEALALLKKVEDAAAAGVDIRDIVSTANFSSFSTAQAFLKILAEMREEKASQEEIAQKLHTNSFARGRTADSPEVKFDKEMAAKMDNAAENLRKYAGIFLAAATAEYAENFVFEKHDLSIRNADGKPHTKKCATTLVGGHLFNTIHDLDGLNLVEVLELIQENIG